MPISNFPNGFPTGVMIRSVPLLQSFPGKVFWLSNNTTGLLQGQRGGSNQNKGGFQDPFSTLAYAITQCVANRGDIIMVKPGHAETISSSSALTLSVAGIAIVGMGVGTQRPTFTIDTANTATINVSADNIAFVNCRVIANFLSIAAAFTLSTAKWFTLQDCTFTETSIVLDFLNIIKSTGAANTVDGLTAINNQWFGLGTTSVNSFLLSANDIDMLTLKGNVCILARTATAAIIGTISAGVITHVIAMDNVGVSLQTADTGGSFINVGGTTSSGIVARNYIGDVGTTSLFMTATVALTFVDNKITGNPIQSGFLLPAVDS